MYLFKSFILIFLLSFFSLTIYANQISWKQCIQEFKSNNPELKIANYNVQLAEKEKIGAYSTFLPTLSLSASQRKTEDKLGQKKDQTSFGLGLTQPLFKGFANVANFKISTLQVYSAKEAYKEELARLGSLLRQAYSSLLYAQELLRLSSEIVKRRRENLNLIKLRFNTGRENKGSLLLSQANLKQAEYEELQAKNNILIYQQDLAKLLGRGTYKNLKVKSDYSVLPSKTKPNLETALKINPSYKITEIEEKIADLTISSTRSNFLPTINLSLNWSKEGEDWFPQDQNKSIGVNFSWDLFSGGKDMASYKSAAIKKYIQMKKRENLTRQLRTNLEQYFLNFEEAFTKKEVDESFQEAAKVRAEIARNKYNNGLLSFEEWETIENDLVTRQKNFLNSQKNLVAAEAKWYEVQGIGDF